MKNLLLLLIFILTSQAIAQQEDRNKMLQNYIKELYLYQAEILEIKQFFSELPDSPHDSELPCEPKIKIDFFTTHTSEYLSGVIDLLTLYSKAPMGDSLHKKLLDRRLEDVYIEIFKLYSKELSIYADIFLYKSVKLKAVDLAKIILDSLVTIVKIRESTKFDYLPDQK